jgi:predicted dehydrogenase
MVRIGLVGIGFMGMMHYLSARKLHGAKVVALCSRDEKKLAGDWRGIHGNFGPRGEVMDLSGLKKYADFADMLADKDVDLIDVCNPTHLHPSTALAALGAGKHVLVEKAIALETRDADAMLAAADAAGKLLMVAHVLPFFPEFAYAATAIRDGKHGKLLGGHFKRVISKPDWSSAIGDAAKTGGPALDLHIHDTHFIGLVCGVPGRVFSTGLVDADAVTYLTTQYLYGQGGPVVSCSSGAPAQRGRPFVHGFEIYLESATLVYESGTCPLTLMTADGKAERVELDNGTDATTAFRLEIQAAADGVRKGRAPNLLAGKLARDALELCHRECESVKTGRAVAVS